MKPLQVCTQCGHHGVPITVTPGSIGIEILLWLFFIIPGLIYSIWRLSARHMACPSCGNQAMIPAHSPRGEIILDEMARTRSTQPIRVRAH